MPAGGQLTSSILCGHICVHGPERDDQLNGLMQDEGNETTPKGIEIPIPKRRDFLRDLRKVAEPKPEPDAK